MVSINTSFYEGEIFYSGVARQFAHLGYPSQSYGIRELFGSRNCKAVIDLPGHLDHYNNCFLNSSATIDGIIDHHTLFPYYSPFLPKDRRNKLRESMHSNVDSPSNIFLGHHILRVSSQRDLHYCPTCIEEDRNRNGEAFWHRSHQTPEVSVCPTHKIPLSKNVEPLLKDHSYLTVESACKSGSWKQIELDEHAYKLNTHLSEDSDWLLQNKINDIDPQSLRDKYFSLLADQGYAIKYGKAVNKAKNLCKSFKEYYSDSYLSFINCNFKDDSPINWLRLLLSSCETHSQPPIHHLLLIHFLGETPDSFFLRKNDDLPFGQGPWACINPVADHYLEKVINECKVQIVSKVESHLIGTFSCDRSGFIYSRSDPNHDLNTSSKYIHVHNRGKVWNNRLRTLWGDPTLTLKEVAKRLGVTIYTVITHAARMGLHFPRPGSRSIAPLITSRKKKIFSIDIPSLRSEWELLLKKHPNIPISKFIKESNGLYYRLLKYDREWLLEHPMRNKRHPPAIRKFIDWNKRDIELSTSIAKAILILRQLPGRPRKITVTSIFHQLRMSRSVYVDVQNGRLPLCGKTISEGVDSRISLGIRKIEYFTQLFINEDHFPSQFQLIMRSGVWAIMEDTRIREVLNRAMNVIALSK